MFLSRLELKEHWDLTTWLDVPFEVTMEQAVARDVRNGADAAVRRAKSECRYVAGQAPTFHDIGDVMTDKTLERIKDGRTDLVCDYLAAGHAATAADEHGTALINWCAYYGDVSAIRFLLANGESLRALGDNLGLSGAAFHGHWRLCQFLLELGADVNAPLPENGETPLHAALSQSDRLAHDLVIEVLLGSGANPNCATKPGAETGSFMRDCRTKGETPLHRAAAFGTENTIRMLLDAGAKIDAKDMNGDSPLGWASWYLRADSILRMLCYGDFHIHPNRRSMRGYLQGQPHVDPPPRAKP